MTITPTVDRMTRDEAKILAHYAAGESAKDIAANTRTDIGTVGLTLDALCGNNRNLAHNLATEWQTRAKAVAASRPASAAPAPAGRTPQPPQATDATPKGVDLQIDDIADLLDASEASGNPKLERAARKIRDLITDIQEQFAEHSRDARLRQEQADLETRLAEIKDQLRGKRTTTAEPAAAASTSAVDTKRVRAWAAASGIACPARGRIPREVVAAYEAATE